MGALIRVILRYGVGTVIGYEMGSRFANDPDVVTVIGEMAHAFVPIVSVIVGAAVEWTWRKAKKFGWSL